ncbi:hypothetical protein TUMEXPCC7403_15595 [Tumidithrix helvetica PCC 7403]|uniref:ParB N-terminal domain-containing protein n=1 Tax=Tumidithrix helvetica TaxID=3457545 RepID=UPI003CB4E2C7
MSLLTESIDIDAIASSVPRSQFSDEFIEQLATSIVKSKGIVNPLILRQKTPMSYEVVEGHLEYYAAVKANQLDSDFEAIRAFVVKSQNEQAIREQVQLLRPAIALPNQSKPKSQNPQGNTINAFTDLQKLAEQVQRIEQKLDTYSARAIDSQKLEERLQRIGQILNADLSTLSQRLDSLSISISASIKSNATKPKSSPSQKELNVSTHKKEKPAAKKKTSSQKEDKPKTLAAKEILQESSKEATVLHQINTLTVRQLALKLSRVGLKETIRENIISARNEGQFNSQTDLLKRVKGLGKKTLEKTLDRWV